MLLKRAEWEERETEKIGGLITLPTTGSFNDLREKETVNNNCKHKRFTYCRPKGSLWFLPFQTLCLDRNF